MWSVMFSGESYAGKPRRCSLTVSGEVQLHWKKNSRGNSNKQQEGCLWCCIGCFPDVDQPDPTLKAAFNCQKASSQGMSMKPAECVICIRLFFPCLLCSSAILTCVFHITACFRGTITAWNECLTSSDATSHVMLSFYSCTHNSETPAVLKSWQS